MAETLTRKERSVQLGEQAKEYGFALTDRKFSARYLRGYKFQATTIFDVGVHSGTPELYKAFSDRKLVLIDPAPAAREAVERRFPNHVEHFHEVGLGAASGSTKLKVLGGGSTILNKAGGHDVKDARFEGEIDIKIETLDRLVEQNGYTGPFGLKIDTEGYELEVLKGATRVLENTEFVITETDVRRRFTNSYEPSELIGLLAGAGLELLAVLNEKCGYQPFYDMLFVRRDHPARQTV